MQWGVSGLHAEGEKGGNSGGGWNGGVGGRWGELVNRVIIFHSMKGEFSDGARSLWRFVVWRVAGSGLKSAVTCWRAKRINSELRLNRSGAESSGHFCTVNQEFSYLYCAVCLTICIVILVMCLWSLNNNSGNFTVLVECKLQELPYHLAVSIPVSLASTVLSQLIP